MPWPRLEAPRHAWTCAGHRRRAPSTGTAFPRRSPQPSSRSKGRQRFWCGARGGHDPRLRRHGRVSKLPSILRAFTGLPSAFGLAFPVEGRSRGDSEMPPRERSSTSGGRQWTMVVAVVAVRVMRVAADAVLNVVAVRHRLVAGAGAAPRLMPAATMVGGAHLGVLARHLDHVLIDMAFVRVVEVTLMQIIDVAPVTDGGVTTTRPVLVSMVGMGRCGAGRHGVISFLCPGSADTAVRSLAACSM